MLVHFQQFDRRERAEHVLFLRKRGWSLTSIHLSTRLSVDEILRLQLLALTELRAAGAELEQLAAEYHADPKDLAGALRHVTPG